MSTEDPYKYFRVEARELLEKLLKGVLDLGKSPAILESTSSLLRYAHTLKGAARVVKQPEIAQEAHAIEELLEPYRDSVSEISQESIKRLLELLDIIGSRIVKLEYPSQLIQTNNIGSEQDSEVNRSIRADISQIDALSNSLREAGTHVALIREKLSQSAEELQSSLGSQWLGVNDSIEVIDRELRQVQDLVEHLRFESPNTLFIDLERTVRDVGQSLGKKVIFKSSGSEVRLDTHVIGALRAALQQVVRNSVAHGIETEDERQAAGKPLHGTVDVSVMLRTTIKGKRVVFQCSDDGRGIDLEAVRSVAISKGIISAGARNMTDQALIDLLLKGGITTSSAITELSGRGIGLDVLRHSVTGLDGEVTLNSKCADNVRIESDFTAGTLENHLLS